MPTALWIAHVTVTDEAAYGEYAKRATVAIAAHQGVFLARGGKHEQRPRNVVARFPSLQAAHDCYYSPAYQEALGFAKGASQRELSIVEEIASVQHEFSRKFDRFFRKNRPPHKRKSRAQGAAFVIYAERAWRLRSCGSR